MSVTNTLQCFKLLKEILKVTNYATDCSCRVCCLPGHCSCYIIQINICIRILLKHMHKNECASDFLRSLIYLKGAHAGAKLLLRPNTRHNLSSVMRKCVSLFAIIDNYCGSQKRLVFIEIKPVADTSLADAVTAEKVIDATQRRNRQSIISDIIPGLPRVALCYI